VYVAKALGVDRLIYYRLDESEGLDWQVETKQGGPFRYREECMDNFPAEYNRERERTRKAAEVLGVYVEELPAPFAEASTKNLAV
jgi:hypothetical protein